MIERSEIIARIYGTVSVCVRSRWHLELILCVVFERKKNEKHDDQVFTMKTVARDEMKIEKKSVQPLRSNEMWLWLAFSIFIFSHFASTQKNILRTANEDEWIRRTRASKEIILTRDICRRKLSSQEDEENKNKKTRALITHQTLNGRTSCLSCLSIGGHL